MITFSRIRRGNPSAGDYIECAVSKDDTALIYLERGTPILEHDRWKIAEENAPITKFEYRDGRLVVQHIDWKRPDDADRAPLEVPLSYATNGIILAGSFWEGANGIYREDLMKYHQIRIEYEKIDTEHREESLTPFTKPPLVKVHGIDELLASLIPTEEVIPDS